VITLSAAAAASAVTVGRAGRSVRRRLPAPDLAAEPSTPRRGHDRLPGRRLALLGAAGWLVALLCLGLPGALAVTAVAGGAVLARARRQRAEARPDCSIAVDLLAGCLAAGATVPDAVAAAASAAPAKTATALSAVAGALRAGIAPAAAWADLDDAGVLADVARACARSAATGAGIAAELHRAAERDRSRRRAQRQQRLQRASVWLVLPLGLCFLPAFVLIGVAPLVLAAVPHVLR